MSDKTTKTQIATRKDYLDGKVTHAAYYAQFVTDHTRGLVATYIGIDRIKRSQDEHLNDIQLAEWDRIPHAFDGDALKDAGDFLSMAGWVCIAKEAARQLKVVAK